METLKKCFYFKFGLKKTNYFITMDIWIFFLVFKKLMKYLFIFKWTCYFFLNKIKILGCFIGLYFLEKKIHLFFASKNFDNVDPYFVRCIPIQWRDSFFYLFWWNFDFFLKRFGVATYFCFIFFFMGKKLIKKTLSVTPYLENTICKKPKSGYLFGRYGKKTISPL